MKKDKKTIVLAGIILALSALFIAGLLIPEAGAGASAFLRVQFLRKDRVAQVSSVSIATNDYEAELLRREGRWFLFAWGREFPAQSGRVESLLAELSAPRRLEKVASGKESWGALGLDKDNAWKLTVKGPPGAQPVSAGSAGTILVDLCFGFTDSSGDRVYLRRAGETSSWRGDSGIFRRLGRKAEDWLDLMLFDAAHAGADLQSLDVIPGGNGASSYSIARNGAEWKFRETAGGALPPLMGKETRRAAAARIVKSVLSLEALGFAGVGVDGAHPPQGGQAKPAGRLILRSGDGATISVDLTESSGSTPLEAAVSGRKWVYLLSRESLAGILP